MKKLKILVVFDSAGPPPKDQDFEEEFKKEDWATEASVIRTLKKSGYDTDMIGVYDDIRTVIDRIQESKPDLVFNLTENFHGMSIYEKNLPALFELMQVPYTGCSADGLAICKNKAMSKKILNYHRIKVPGFQVFPRDSKRKPRKRLRFPVIVKPLTEEASIGIAQGSFVTDEQGLIDRVKFIHDSMCMHAIAEEYIDGRELYVSVLGNRRLKVLPAREMKFSRVPEEDPKIATYKAKWDKKYREKWGIRNGFPDKLPHGVQEKISKISKKAYRALNLSGYARFDIRLTGGNDIYIIEANANPALAPKEDFAMAASKAGISYESLVKIIANLSLKTDYLG
ncbi:MAG: ATP-grasp domain-containing protein [Elusimicrobia bacterium]|nr:ATP-grasp domain-containing protein [Elusimicrobiota bacterium]